MAGGGKVEVSLADDTSSGTFPQGAVKLDATDDLDKELGPAGSGGLIAALHLWRQLLILGPEKFGDVYYYGTAPFPGIAGQADVLAATRNVAEMNFVFDPATGQLAVAEVAVDPEGDPCEIRFSDYRDQSGRQIPHRLEVHHAGAIFAHIEWTTIELPSTAKEQP